METSVDRISETQTKIKIELEADAVDKAMALSLGRYKSQANIPGYRKGKAPTALLKKQYGESIAADTADSLIREHLFKAIENEKLRPVAPPVLESEALPQAGKPYEIVAVLETLPELVIESYPDLKLAYDRKKFLDDDVEKVEFGIRKSLSKEEDLSEDDAKTATFASGLLGEMSLEIEIDGEVKPEFSAPEISVLHDDPSIWAPLKDNVAGMKIGEQKSCEITLDGKLHGPDWDGKKATMKVDLKNLKKNVLEDLTDEAAKEKGFKDADDWKKSVRANLERDAEDITKRNQEVALNNALLNSFPVELPPSIYADYIDRIIDQKLGGADQTYLKKAKEDPKVRELFLEEAKTQAKVHHIVWEIVKKEELKASDDDVETYMMRGVPVAQDEEQTKTLKAQVEKNIAELKGRSTAWQNVQNQIVYQKAVDFLVGKASHEIKNTVSVFQN